MPCNTTGIGRICLFKATVVNIKINTGHIGANLATFVEYEEIGKHNMSMSYPLKGLYSCRATLVHWLYLVLDKAYVLLLWGHVGAVCHCIHWNMLQPFIKGLLWKNL